MIGELVTALAAAAIGGSKQSQVERLGWWMMATARANRPEMVAEKAVPARKEAVKPVQAESKADTSSRPQLCRQRKISATKKATSNGSRPTIQRRR